MTTQTKEMPAKQHMGQNVQKVRLYFGIKQDALAAELGISQSAVSKIEQQEEIEDGLLGRISGVLGISKELLQSFESDKAIYNINNHHIRDNTFSENSIAKQFNPVEKIVELYERLLRSEREKVDMLMNKNI